MIITRETLRYLWEDVLSHKRLLIVYGSDVDSVCALASFLVLLRRHDKEYTTLLYNDLTSLSLREHMRDSSTKAVVMINCTHYTNGNIYDVFDKQIPEHVEIVYVFDAFRPFERSQTVFNKVSSLIRTKPKQTKAGDNKGTDRFAFYVVHENELDVDTRDESDLITGRAPIKYPCALMILHLANVTDASMSHNRDIVWYAIVATTYYFLHDKCDWNRYRELVQQFEDYCQILNRLDEKEDAKSKDSKDVSYYLEPAPMDVEDNTLAKPKPSSPPVSPNRTGQLRSATHYRLPLARYCPLWQSMSHSPVVLSAWSPLISASSLTKSLHQFCCSVGVPVHAAKQLAGCALFKNDLLGTGLRPVDGFCQVLYAYIQNQKTVLALTSLNMFYASFSLYRRPDLEVEAADLVHMMEMLCTSEDPSNVFQAYTLLTQPSNADLWNVTLQKALLTLSTLPTMLSLLKTDVWTSLRVHTFLCDDLWMVQMMSTVLLNRERKLNRSVTRILMIVNKTDEDKESDIILQYDWRRYIPNRDRVVDDLKKKQNQKKTKKKLFALERSPMTREEQEDCEDLFEGFCDIFQRDTIVLATQREFFCSIHQNLTNQQRFKAWLSARTGTT